jgi:gamma-glutamylcyclotransferase (GGCT)/AIG2-like uncharacterized protein YtfP
MLIVLTHCDTFQQLQMQSARFRPMSLFYLENVNIKIFVYGSLKPDEFNYFVCADRVVSVEAAIAYGSLFHLPLGYPAMTLGTVPIQGYILTFTDAEILLLLDDFEDEYERQLIDTFTLDAQFLTQAWAYLMSIAQINQLKGIPVLDGNWSHKKYP